MLKITSCLTAVALAATTIAASAQDGTTRSDMFGQDQTTAAGDASVPVQVPSSPKRVVITNNPGLSSSAATAATANRAQSAAGVPNPYSAGAPNPYGARAVAGLPNVNGVLPSGQINGQRPATGEQPVLNEFQKFILDSSGKLLPMFGTDFFANSPSTFAPVTSAPVPADYSLGPGDELLIRGWGTVDIDFRATIDRNGSISIPSVGSVALAGTKAADAEKVIRTAVAKLYKGVTVSVNFGQLRAITVYVVGQAKHPGTYTVSSMSTLVTALFASGGPGSNGSMRHVQVKRGGRVVGDLDLYSFIAKGDKSADIKLLDGDTIFIPAATGYVALVGKVNSPAIYELKGAGEPVRDLLDLAGGVPVDADPKRVFLERIDPDKKYPRTVEQLALNNDGMNQGLKNGDVINVASVTPDFSNAVMLRGNVDQPVRAPFKQGMRVSDLIPSRDYLITRASIRRQNQVIATTDEDQNETATQNVQTIAASIGGLIDPINWDYAVIERVNRKDLSVSLIPFTLGNVFDNPDGPDNVVLQPGDTVTTFSQNDVAVPINKRRVFVRIEGEVMTPGVYQMNAGDTVQVLMAKAGGPTSSAYLFGTEFYRDKVRKEQEVNLQRAATRLESQLRSEQSRGIANVAALGGADAQLAEAERTAQLQVAKESVSRLRQLKPTGRIAFGLEPSETSFAHLPPIRLENGDRLVIPAKPAYVQVFGSVNTEASALWRPNARVKDYLNQAGTTVDADLENVFVMRVDGTVVSETGRWSFGGIGGVEVMPGDSIVVPEKFDKETAWTKFTKGTREWAQIFANFGLGAAAVKTLRN
jgi:protein involved in polysaccharide export with SLBB domain